MKLSINSSRISRLANYAGVAGLLATTIMSGSLAAAEPPVPTISAAEQEVIAAIAKSKPGDTIIVKTGFYKGGWILKPGEPGKPITLKAERAGRVFIGSLDIIIGFEPVPGAQYSFSSTHPAAPPKLRELDTGKELRSMAMSTIQLSDADRAHRIKFLEQNSKETRFTPAIIDDVEEVAGSYCFDEETKRLYIHPSDSAGVAHHTYAPIPTTDGITLANHTVVDGFVMTGFGGAAIHAGGGGVEGATIQNCKLYRNGSAISLGAAKKCVIRNNECWANKPDYSQAGQIFCQDGTEDTLIEGNYVHDGGPDVTGIWIYGDSDRNIFRSNVVWQASGLAAKGHGPMQNVSEYNVSDGLVATLVMRGNTGSHSDTALGLPDPQSDLLLNALKADAKFADPAWADCRLQSDSPARGKAKDGKDLGALQYKGEVLFVKPDGNDKAEGTSIASAWKTLAHAGKNLKAGQTLYILPGNYAESLVLQDKVAAAGLKTLVRVHDKGIATVQRIEIKDCTALELANLSVQQAKGTGVTLTQSRQITLLNCASYNNKGDGVSVADCVGVSLQGCALWNNAVGLRTTRSRDVELVSSIVGENAQAQVQLAEGTEGYFGEFNTFSGAMVGVVAAANGQARDITAWRTLSGSESRSLTSTEKPMAPEKGDFRVAAGTVLGTAGLYASPVGPHGLFVAEKVARKRIERVEVVSVTRTSANLLWYTPGRMIGTALKWGLTAEYGETYDRTSSMMSEFELVHTVSLINLKPNTTYHFRPGALDVTGGEEAFVWDENDYTFTTADKDPVPRQLFVSTTGDDTKDGLTSQTAWKTLHKAARQAHAGDTVTIAPGRYVELLRPLQTGTSEDRRITFRAEKPLSVFLEGGIIKFVRAGRPHAVQLHGKAYITIENLTGMMCSEGLDYGGYRGGWGYAGLFRMSGGCMNEFKGCVADARYRWMSGFAFCDAGVMPGLVMPPYAAKVSDSVTLACWRGIQGQVQRAPLILDHNIYYVSLTGMYSPFGGEKWISRNCIYQDMVDQKRKGPYTRFWNAAVSDSDYGCWAWMPESTRLIATSTLNGTAIQDEDKGIAGLTAWQETSKRDLHSIEHTPTYGITALELGKGSFDLRPLTIQDFILPKDSPLRGKGENGSDIGVRWEKYIDPTRAAALPAEAVKPLAAGATAVDGEPNLLLNSSFEDVNPGNNIPDGWDICGGLLKGNIMQMDNAVAHSGSKSLYMKLNPGASSEVILSRECHPPLTPGKTYTFSAWVKTRAISERAYLFISQYPAPFTAATSGQSDVVSGDSNWTQLKLVFKARPGLSGVQLRCGIYGSTGGEAWFDDVAITEGTLAPGSVAASAN